jgi:hypothetical protein
MDAGSALRAANLRFKKHIAHVEHGSPQPFPQDRAILAPFSSHPLILR